MFRDLSVFLGHPDQLVSVQVFILSSSWFQPVTERKGGRDFMTDSRALLLVGGVKMWQPSLFRSAARSSQCLQHKHRLKKSEDKLTERY